MVAPTQPSEIAREVLRLFAARRLPPTPDNFRDLYHEVAGIPDEDGSACDHLLRELARRLPTDTAERVRLIKQLQRAVSDKKRSEAETALFAYLNTIDSDEPPAWNALIGNLLRQWEARQIGWTTARKRESLERVLAANDPTTLYGRLGGLVKAWSQAPGDPETPLGDAPSVGVPMDITGTPVHAPSAAHASAPVAQPEVRLIGQGDSHELINSLRELLLLTLNTVLPAMLGAQPELDQEVQTLAAAVRASHQPEQLRTVALQLRKLAYRLELATGDAEEIRAGLVNLLRLVLENIGEIVVDDRWLKGQIEVLREVIERPAHVRMIDDAERRLKEVIYKQSQLKHNLVETQRHLRQMLAGFVDQLARFSESTGAYHDRIGSCAQRIAEANDISAIGPLLDEVMQETRSMQDEAQRSRDELIATREQARLAEERIAKLQEELDEASRQMRHDQLTGTLNRRGLEEVFEKEAARAQRRGSTLSIGLLDIDHFKKLNDTLGHHTGDAALVHLANVVRKHLRPQDVLARFGGEEFLILLPETETDDAYRALIRLQRELTREFFMADQQKIVITFSAGVTPLGTGESFDAAMKRADAAMYQAKQAGRNRVMQAPLKQAAV